MQCFCGNSARLVASEQPVLNAGQLVACQALRYPQGASSFESPSGSGQQAHPHGHSSVVMRRSQLTKKEKQPAMDGACQTGTKHCRLQSKSTLPAKLLDHMHM